MSENAVVPMTGTNTKIIFERLHVVKIEVPIRLCDDILRDVKKSIPGCRVEDRVMRDLSRIYHFHLPDEKSVYKLARILRSDLPFGVTFNNK